MELICVFLRGGASRYRMGNSSTAWGFSGPPLIHNLLEAVIETVTAEARGRRVPGPGSPEMRPNVIKSRSGVLNQTRPSYTHTHRGEGPPLSAPNQANRQTHRGPSALLMEVRLQAGWREGWRYARLPIPARSYAIWQ